MPGTAPPQVVITDVTLREHGQNVPEGRVHEFPPALRVRLAEALIRAGIRSLELFSCVSPRVAPAMERGLVRRVAEALGRREGVRFITLVPNERGFHDFMDLGLGPSGFNHTAGLFFSAVEEHNLANLGRGIRESLKECRRVLRAASLEGVAARGYVSAAFGYRDPAGGTHYPSREDVAGFVDFFLEQGAEEVILSDLQGVAGEEEIYELFSWLMERSYLQGSPRLGFHPHHVSSAMAVRNSLAAYRAGIRLFDASLGGTGGCVTGAPGNQSTGELVRAFHQAGVETGIQPSRLPPWDHSLTRD